MLTLLNSNQVKLLIPFPFVVTCLQCCAIMIIFLHLTKSTKNHAMKHYKVKKFRGIPSNYY